MAARERTGQGGRGKMQQAAYMSGTGGMSGLNTTSFDSQSQPSEPMFNDTNFDELFMEYQPLVYGIGLKFTGNPEDAEDITQEVFTKVWKKLASFNYNSSFKTWIYRIALNTCVDYSRKPWKRYSKRAPELENKYDDSEETSLTSDEESAERKLILSEKAAQVRKAISKLKPHLKSVVVLKDLEELSYQEISSVLGLSMGTISSRLNRARKALQAALGPSFQTLMEES